MKLKNTSRHLFLIESLLESHQTLSHQTITAPPALSEVDRRPGDSSLSLQITWHCAGHHGIVSIKRVSIRTRVGLDFVTIQNRILELNFEFI